jgi:hypothetical protein
MAHIWLVGGFLWFLGFCAYVRLEVMMSPITIFKDANQLGLGTYLVSLLCVSGWCWGPLGCKVWSALRWCKKNVMNPRNTHTIWPEMPTWEVSKIPSSIKYVWIVSMSQPRSNRSHTKTKFQLGWVYHGAGRGAFRDGGCLADSVHWRHVTWPDSGPIRRILTNASQIWWCIWSE